MLLLLAQVCPDEPRYPSTIEKLVNLPGRCDSIWSARDGVIAVEARCGQFAILDDVTGDCVCPEGYYGNGKTFCVSSSSSSWKTLDSYLWEQPSARKGHGFAILDFQSAWLFGGVDRGGLLLRDVSLLSLESYRWTLFAGIDTWPSAR